MAIRIPKFHIILFSEGKTDYTCTIATTTGHVAITNYRNECLLFQTSGETTINIARSTFIALWSCGGTDVLETGNVPKPVGDITFLDCSGNNLREIEIVSETLADLRCSHNKLRELKLHTDEETGRPAARALQRLDCSHNLLGALDLTHLKSIKTVNCANNHLRSIRLSSQLSDLEYLNCRSNRLRMIDLTGLKKLQQYNASENELGLWVSCPPIDSACTISFRENISCSDSWRFPEFYVWNRIRVSHTKTEIQRSPTQSPMFRKQYWTDAIKLRKVL